MTMPALAPKSIPEPKTKAMLALEQNFASIMHMMQLSTLEMEMAAAQSANARRSVAHLQRGDPIPTDALKGLITSLDAIASRLDRLPTLTLWQVVMLVTCVEVYLQDMLAAAARVDPELMRESDQRARYADIIEATSLEVLANELRTRWARRWLSDGGPTHWISRLKKMGAKGYPDDLAPHLERFWGIRHVVVHAAGVATADFVKRHPGVVKAAGDRVRVTPHDLRRLYDATLAFLKPTETYFLARWPSLDCSIHGSGE